MQRQLRQLASFVMVLVCATATDAKIVSTTYGQVEGNTITLDDGTTVNSWYGIPYAKPPVGELRFEPPQPPASWSEVFNAKHLPNSCMQSYMPSYPVWTNLSEDCLNLNIFAPEDLSGAPLAVMVWIHGGGYLVGANSQTFGHFLAAKDVIVVIPNYRLGIFGFLSTSDGTIKGNMGLKDQRLALIWVRDNIANFGGDPSRVTIFGESAGATSVSLQLLSPLARGLFHQAIAVSGTDITYFAVNPPSRHPEKFVYLTAGRLNCTRPTDSEIVACLKTKTATELIDAQGVPCPGLFCFGYAPVVDGAGGYLPKTPAELQVELDPNDAVPFISGFTRDDGAFFAAVDYPELFYGGLDRTQFELRLRQFVNTSGYGPRPDQIETVFQAIRWNYIDWSNADNMEANRLAIVRIVTDFNMGSVWDRQLKAKSNKSSNVYGFVFAFLSPNVSSGSPPWMGVSHGMDVPYVFGSPKLIHNPDVRTDTGKFIDEIGWTADDVIFAEYMMTLWTNFATYGNPTPTPIGGPFDSNSSLTWSKFSTRDDLKILYLDANARTIQNYNQKNYAFINDFLVFVNETAAPTQPTCPPSGGKKRRRRFNGRPRIKKYRRMRTSRKH